jgi:MFS family permease
LRAATAATTLGYAAQGLLPVTFPLLAVHFGHPAAHGAWFLTAMSAGSLVGALASARLLTRFPPLAVLGAALAVLGGALAGIAAAPTFGAALAVATAGGVATGPMLAATLAVRQRSVPSGRYGQVVATAASIKVGAFALGAAATGTVTAALPPRGVLLLVGAAQFAALLPLRTVRAGRPGRSGNPAKSARVPA